MRRGTPCFLSRRRQHRNFPIISRCLILLIVAVVLASALVGLSWILGPKKPSAAKLAPYECGVTPVGSARERFPVKFYLIAMLFIVFDIETVFLYPWAVTFTRWNTTALQIFSLLRDDRLYRHLVRRLHLCLAERRV